MKAVLIGSVSSSVAALRGMLRGGLDVAGVCGLHDRYAETVSDYHDLRPLAESAAIPYLGFDKVVEPAVREFLAEMRPDWLFVIGLSQLVPAEMRALAKAGAIGFHPTMLPEGRGRAPVAWTILLGRAAAANLFFMTDEADAGDIIGQRPVPVLPDDYAADLIARTNAVLEEMMAELAPAFAVGRVPRTPQDPARASYYPRRRPEDGRIDWRQPVEQVYRLVRAVSHPYPGAFSLCGGKKVIIWRAAPRKHEAAEGLPQGAPPGTVVGSHEGWPVVQTASGLLALTDIQWEGGAGTLAAGSKLE